MAGLNQGTIGTGATKQTVALTSQMRQMDDLTKRIQSGKATLRETHDTVIGTNKLYEYQHALQGTSLENVKACFAGF